jgi:membrane-associated phospholipid phosphatase
VWDGLVRFAKWVARPHNYAPSLHVALSVVCIRVYARHANRAGKVFLWLWAAGIAVSTVLLHQHYLVDVVTGFLLGLAGVRWVYDRRLAAARAPSPPGKGEEARSTEYAVPSTEYPVRNPSAER